MIELFHKYNPLVSKLVELGIIEKVSGTLELQE